MAYAQVKFSDTTQELNDILVALLAGLQYEGFEEEKDGLKAFVPLGSFDQKELDLLIAPFGLTYTFSELPDTNWNEIWESNFHPVIVDDFCIIRASFHEPAQNIRHEIVITPKMSFGTGHHPTTYMMIQQMRTLDFTGKKVFDFGTGTGVLAILAQQLGAAAVLAIDNDEWSIANAEENFIKNDVASIELLQADNAAAGKQFDIILANITRNVILDNFQYFRDGLSAGGVLVLSGLLREDEKDIVAHAVPLGFIIEKQLQRDNWISLLFKKHNT